MERMTDEELVNSSSLLDTLDQLIGIHRSDLDKDERLILAENLYREFWPKITGEAVEEKANSEELVLVDHWTEYEYDGWASQRKAGWSAYRTANQQTKHHAEVQDTNTFNLYYRVDHSAARITNNPEILRKIEESGYFMTLKENVEWMV